MSSEGMEYLEIHRVLEESGPPQGAGDTETIRQLRVLVSELDRLAGSAKGFDLALVLYGRCAAHSRLILGSASPEEAVREAELGFADGIAGLSIFRELALRGGSTAKVMWGACAQRVATVFQWRPDRTLELAAAVEAVLDEYANLVVDATGVSARARLGWGLAIMSEGATEEGRRAAAGCQVWTDKAYELAEAVWAAGAEIDATELVQLIGYSATVAPLVADPAVEPQRFVNLINRRQAQFEAVRPRVPVGPTMAAVDDAKLRIAQALAGASRQMLGDVDEQTDEAAAVPPLIFRHLSHQLAPTLWRRDLSAAEIVARQEAHADDPGAELQAHLDELEIALVAAVLRGFGADLPALAKTFAAGDEVGEALFALAMIGPLPSPAYLAAAAARLNGRPATEQEADARDLLDAIRNISFGAEKLVVEDISSVFLLAMRMESGEATDPAAVHDAIRDLVGAVCIPLGRLDPVKGDLLLGFLFLSIARASSRWRPEELRQALGWLDEFDQLLAGSATGAAVLELTEAQLAFRLAARDADAFPRAHRAAGAFVRRFEADPGDFAAGAFGVGPFLDCLRVLALAELNGVRLSLFEPTEAGGEAAKAALRGFAEDPGCEAEVRAAAGRHLAEVELEENFDADGFGEMLDLEWDDELLVTRSIGFLIGFLGADEKVAAAVDPDRVRRAVAAAIEHIRDLGTVGAREGSFLPLLTDERARARMGIGSVESLELGRAAVVALDPEQVEAAVMGIKVALGLSDLRHDRVAEAGSRQLAELAAQRFLPVALEDPLGKPALVRFLISVANLALNHGSVRQKEVHHRQRVALAAHLLAVAGEDRDGAAMAAYMSAELCRLIGQFETAARWMAVYDTWCRRGGLADDAFAHYKESIEWDRRQLLQALSIQKPEAGEEVGPVPEDLADADDSGRLTTVANGMAKDPLRPLDAGDEAALRRAVEVDLPPVLLVHHWVVALGVCARAAAEHPRRDLLAETTAAVGAALLGGAQSATVDGAALVPVLEVLVEAAIAVGNRDLAELAVGRLAATYSALFLSAGLGAEFLALRPTTGGLRKAALRIFEQGDLQMALEIAETGRMKLLSSLASGGPRGESGAPPPAATMATEPEAELGTEIDDEAAAYIVERLVAVIREPDAAAIDALVGAELDAEQLALAARALVLPWVRLASTYEEQARGAGLSDEAWGKALSEPSLNWLAGALGERQVLIYLFIDDGFRGAVVLTKQDLFSFVQAVENEEEGVRATVEMVFGRDVLNAAVARLDGDEPAEGGWDVRLVTWDGGSEESAQRVGTGFWLTPLLFDERPVVPLVMPTARLLQMSDRDVSLPPRVVSFLGDPTGELAGPWVEGIGWSDAFGPALRASMGPDATREAALTALRGSDLVVLSGHTFGEVGKDGFGFGLADGVITAADLLEVQGEVRATTAILSCCSAASFSRSVEAEVVGMATALVGLGVRQILAPLVPIDDPAAAVFGSRMAVAISAGHDLRSGLIEVARECLAPTPPTVSVALPAAWADLCPHDELTPYAQVSREELIRLLCKLSVFGGGR